MQKIKVIGQTVQTGEHRQDAHRHTDRRTDATMYIISLLRYSYAVDKKPISQGNAKQR